MNLPRNGSALANGLFIAMGVLIGAVITMPIGRTLEPDGELSSRRSSKRAHSLSKADVSSSSPRVLVAKALGENDPNSRASQMRAAGATAAGENVADALRLARDLASVQDRLDFHRGIFGVWADMDPTAALNCARDNFSAGAIQSETIGIVINKWGADHPHEAWVWADQNLTGPLKERAMTDILVGWTRRSPELASDWLSDSGLTSQPLINAVARTWAEQDPLSAAAWAEQQPEGVPKQTAEVAVASEWASQEPEKAAEFYAEIASTDDGLNLAIALTDVWATTDPAATAEWISKLPASASRDQSAGALATIWAATDINAAIEWGTGITDDAMRGQVIAHLGTTWGAIEPLDAIDWLTSLPPNEASEGIIGAFYSWAGTAPQDLQQWINDNPPSDLGDRARLSLGDVLTASDVPTAMELALGMNSAAARDEAVSRFFHEWRKTDDSSAQDWLDGNWSTLPAGAQQRIAREQARDVIPR